MRSFQPQDTYLRQALFFYSLSLLPVAVQWSLWSGLMSSVTHPLPNWCVFTLPPRWSFCLAHTLTALSAPTGQQWKKKLAGVFLLLLPFPPLFCRQVQDYWVQKHQPQMLSIYSKMLGTKGETQTSQKFTQILCWDFFFFFPTDFEPSDSLCLQPYSQSCICDLGRVQGDIWLGNFWVGGKLLQYN